MGQFGVADREQLPTVRLLFMITIFRRACIVFLLFLIIFLGANVRFLNVTGSILENQLLGIRVSAGFQYIAFTQVPVAQWLND